MTSETELPPQIRQHLLTALVDRTADDVLTDFDEKTGSIVGLAAGDVFRDIVKTCGSVIFRRPPIRRLRARPSTVWG